MCFFVTGTSDALVMLWIGQSCMPVRPHRLQIAQHSVQCHVYRLLTAGGSMIRYSAKVQLAHCGDHAQAAPHDGMHMSCTSTLM